MRFRDLMKHLIHFWVVSALVMFVFVILVHSCIGIVYKIREYQGSGQPVYPLNSPMDAGSGE